MWRKLKITWNSTAAWKHHAAGRIKKNFPKDARLHITVKLILAASQQLYYLEGTTGFRLCEHYRGAFQVCREFRPRKHCRCGWGGICSKQHGKTEKKERKNEKNVSSKVQEAQREVQMRRWDRDDITKFRTHLFFSFFLQEENRCLLEGGKGVKMPGLKFTSDASFKRTVSTGPDKQFGVKPLIIEPVQQSRNTKTHPRVGGNDGETPSLFTDYSWQKEAATCYIYTNVVSITVTQQWYVIRSLRS